MDLFTFDIECVGAHKDYDTFKLKDEIGSKIFAKKYSKMNWDKKYENINTAYLEIAGTITTYANICCISFGYTDNNNVKQIRSYYGDDEREIVNNFNNLLKKIETKNFILCGYRILYYDLVFILHKLHKYGIEPAEIIRPYDKKPWDMRIVDMADDWRQKMSYQFSFDEMCYELGVDSPKQHMDGSMVHEAYWNGEVERIKDYCEQDVRASIEAGILLYGK